MLALFLSSSIVLQLLTLASVHDAARFAEKAATMADNAALESFRAKEAARAVEARLTPQTNVESCETCHGSGRLEKVTEAPLVAAIRAGLAEAKRDKK
ncbi:MAG: hypothetical protein ACRD8A_12755 [Candidatus Acidiferrales bacterium]